MGCQNSSSAKAVEPSMKPTQVGVVTEMLIDLEDSDGAQRKQHNESRLANQSKNQSHAAEASLSITTVEKAHDSSAISRQQIQLTPALRQEEPYGAAAAASGLGVTGADTLRRGDTITEQQKSPMASAKTPYLEETPGRQVRPTQQRINRIQKTSYDNILSGASSPEKENESPRSKLLRELENHVQEDEEQQSQSMVPPSLHLNRNLNKSGLNSAIVSYQVNTINLDKPAKSVRINPSANNNFTLPPSMRGEGGLDAMDPIKNLRPPGYYGAQSYTHSRATLEPMMTASANTGLGQLTLVNPSMNNFRGTGAPGGEDDFDKEQFKKEQIDIDELNQLLRMTE